MPIAFRRVIGILLFVENWCIGVNFNKKKKYSKGVFNKVKGEFNIV